MSLPRRVYEKVKNRLHPPPVAGPSLRDPKLLARIHPHSLLFNYGNVYSQRGQDGILREIFSRLPSDIGRTFVEFGAWDGIFLSNCRWLTEQGWAGVYIEGDPERFKTLTQNYAGNERISCINAFIGAPKFQFGKENVGQILQRHGLDPASVTFVSIDIDGRDLDVFRDLGFRPPVILVEGGFDYDPHIEDPLPPAMAEKLQQPLGYIFQQVRACGYTPVCFLQDTYAVRNDLAAPFAQVSPDAVEQFRDAYRFMDKDWRETLLREYRSNPEIHTFEIEKRGRVRLEPIDL